MQANSFSLSLCHWSIHTQTCKLKKPHSGRTKPLIPCSPHPVSIQTERALCKAVITLDTHIQSHKSRRHALKRLCFIISYHKMRNNSQFTEVTKASWLYTSLYQESDHCSVSTDSWWVANAIWGWLQQWKQTDPGCCSVEWYCCPGREHGCNWIALAFLTHPAVTRSVAQHS